MGRMHDYEPTPSEIAERCAEIRATWSEERLAKSGDGQPPVETAIVPAVKLEWVRGLLSKLGLILLLILPSLAQAQTGRVTVTSCVENRCGQGTGTVLRKRGRYYVLTCAHVVEPTGTHTVTVRGSRIPAKLVKRHRDADLALLSFRWTGGELRAATLGECEYKAGRELIVNTSRGYKRFRMAGRGTLLSGRRTWHLHGRPPIVQGDSGAGVFHAGKLVGVAWGGESADGSTGAVVTSESISEFFADLQLPAGASILASRPLARQEIPIWVATRGECPSCDQFAADLKHDPDLYRFTKRHNVRFYRAKPQHWKRAGKPITHVPTFYSPDGRYFAAGYRGAVPLITSIREHHGLCRCGRPGCQCNRQQQNCNCGAGGNACPPQESRAMWQVIEKRISALEQEVEAFTISAPDQSHDHEEFDELAAAIAKLEIDNRKLRALIANLANSQITIEDVQAELPEGLTVEAVAAYFRENPDQLPPQSAILRDGERTWLQVKPLGRKTPLEFNITGVLQGD